jgi:hypothetical protein
MENEYLKGAILEVVENQLKSLNPPETKETFERLLGMGYSETDAKEMIGVVVSSEIFDIMKKEEPFNKDRFVKALNKLPENPK